MSAGNKKRKRTESSDEPPAKVQVVEETNQGNKNTSDPKSRGKSRQAKSERRSKKPAKNTSVLSQAQNLPQTNIPFLSSTPASAHGDNLANGEDFVSLSVDVERTVTSQTSQNATTKTKPPKKTKAKSTTSASTTTTNAPTNPSSNKSTSKPKPKSSSSSSKKDRFILFIGNLPYATTTPSIQAHFSSLQPFTVRHNTDKSTGKSKGFAFLEFENYDRMKTCLKLYHHSIFDPDNQVPQNSQAQTGEEQENSSFPSTTTSSSNNSRKGKRESLPQVQPPSQSISKSKSKTARRINVELTAGGGGTKSEGRKDRIKLKNQKLSEQRERQHEREVEERAKAEKKDRKNKEKRKGKGEGAATETDAGVDAEEKADGRGNVHPSRMARVAH